MSTAPVLARSAWEQLEDIWRDLDVPDGWCADVIAGEIVMARRQDLATIR